MPDIPHLLTNPVFIAIILTMLATGCHFFESWLDRKRPTPPGFISFTSDRKTVSLSRGEIHYVESNDDRRFKNYTPISQWEANLSPQFIRIHRAFLVNRAAISRVDVDHLYLGDIQLPVSRKYREVVAGSK